MAKYKRGDVLEVITYDQGEGKWDMGIIRILEYVPVSVHTKNGIYETQNIKGNVTWLCVNADVLNEAGDIDAMFNPHDTFVRYLGNYPNDKTIEVLFGRT